MWEDKDNVDPMKVGQLHFPRTKQKYFPAGFKIKKIQNTNRLFPTLKEHMDFADTWIDTLLLLCIRPSDKLPPIM